MDTNVLLKVENTRIWQNGQRKFVVVQSLNCVRLFMTPMDCSPPGSSVHGFPRQEYWSGLPFPFPGIFPDQGCFLWLLLFIVRIGDSIILHPEPSVLMDMFYSVLSSTVAISHTWPLSP